MEIITEGPDLRIEVRRVATYRLGSTHMQVPCDSDLDSELDCRLPLATDHTSRDHWLQLGLICV